MSMMGGHGMHPLECKDIGDRRDCLGKDMPGKHPPKCHWVPASNAKPEDNTNGTCEEGTGTCSLM